MKKEHTKGEMEMKATVEDVIESGDLVIVDGKMVISMAGKELDHGK